MIRKIIHIDEEKCNGCGLCATACHEGAIDIIDGKAKLVREHFCDGLGDCLPACPTGAITFEEREAPAYDEAAVKASQEATGINAAHAPGGEACGCPSSAPRSLGGCPSSAPRNIGGCPSSASRSVGGGAGMDTPATHAEPSISGLRNWPVQIQLAPTRAPYFDGADLLIAADCTAFAYANFHRDFMDGRVTLIGCPKLDFVDYSEKLTEIIRNNDIKSVTLLRMEVPCCGGLERAASMALMNSGKNLPWNVVTIGIEGGIVG